MLNRYTAFLTHLEMRHCRGKYRRILRKSILTQAKKLPTSVSYGNQKLYFNPMIFRLENLAVVENTVKHIHFQGHIEKLNALQQSCVVYFYFFFPAGLNSLDTKFAERTCYVFLNAPKIKFSIEDFFSKCDRIHKKLWIWLHLLHLFFV